MKIYGQIVSSFIRLLIFNLILVVECVEHFLFDMVNLKDLKSFSISFDVLFNENSRILGCFLIHIIMCK